MKKTIFLTGASGNMGQEGLKLLLKKSDRFNIVALVLPTKNDKKIVAAYASEPALKIVWGDLTNYDDVLKCVTGADYVLHVGALVSPMADHLPELATKVNIGSIKNIVVPATRSTSAFMTTTPSPRPSPSARSSSRA